MEIDLSAHVLPKLPSNIPSLNLSKDGWPHLNNLRLADPNYTWPGRIDLLIGSDYYGYLLEGPLIKGPVGAPVAQLTKLGWMISGFTSVVQNNSEIHAYHCSIDHDLSASLERFWHQEEIRSLQKKPLTSDEENCVLHFSSTHSRDTSGRYVVRLPFKRSIDQIGDSESQAFGTIHYLQRKLRADPVYYNAYKSFMSEYENLDHMIKVPEEAKDLKPAFYLPHHGIMRTSGSESKLRVVFNGSCKTSTDLSLNAALHTGPRLQIDLLDVLLWIRQYRYIFSTDIEKMYRQIKVDQNDWRFQRILWFVGQKIVKYHLTTVTYGLACAPFLALRSIEQLIQDEGNRFPLAIEILEKGRYVNDIFGGADSLSEAQQQVTQLNQLCLAGGFPLRKWISNDPDLLSEIPMKYQTKSSSLPIKSEFVQTLGLSWNPSSDTFHFLPSSCFVNTERPTKRTVLSTIAKLFDPFGFL